MPLIRPHVHLTVAIWKMHLNDMRLTDLQQTVVLSENRVTWLHRSNLDMGMISSILEALTHCVCVHTGTMGYQLLLLLFE